MKKHYFLSIFIVIVAILFSGNSFAQKKLVNKAFTWAKQGTNLDTALKALDAAANDPTTKDWAKTYYAYALVYQAIGNTQVPEFKSLEQYPFIKAFDNFKKTYYMKGGSAFKTDIDFALTSMPNILANAGVEAYSAENFSDAFKYFEKSYEVTQMPVFGGSIDTILIFNTALMAFRSNDYDNAIKYYTKAAELGYGEGDTYAILAESYKGKSDNEGYVRTLKEGFDKYPSNENLIGGIINYYILEVENTDEAFKYIDMALQKDPSNAYFHSAKGHLYDKTGQVDAAKASYNKAIELKPDLFEAYYNIGVIYYNEGVNLTEEANTIKDNKLYEEAKLVADKKFEESLPYIEKAYELHPEDRSIGGTLSNLYYRLKMIDKYDEIMKKLE
ncbi:MAG: tetratricopeptide repeat protein [Bacteroidales bacterium]